MGGSRDAGALKGPVDALCLKLSFEFNKDIWVACW
jgi:hypothetical protein